MKGGPAQPSLGQLLGCQGFPTVHKRSELALPHIPYEEEGHATLAMTDIRDGIDGGVSRIMGGRLRLASMSGASTPEDHIDPPQEGRDGGCAGQSRDAAPVDHAPGADGAGRWAT